MPSERRSPALVFFALLVAGAAWAWWTCFVLLVLENVVPFAWLGSIPCDAVRLVDVLVPLTAFALTLVGLSRPPHILVWPAPVGLAALALPAAVVFVFVTGLFDHGALLCPAYESMHVTYGFGRARAWLDGPVRFERLEGTLDEATCRAFRRGVASAPSAVHPPSGPPRCELSSPGSFHEVPCTFASGERDASCYRCAGWWRTGRYHEDESLELELASDCAHVTVFHFRNMSPDEPEVRMAPGFRRRTGSDEGAGRAR